MNHLNYRSDVVVQLDDFMGDDAKVIRMAKASIKRTGGDMDQAAREGFINFLVRERHGVPVEHCAFTFYVEAPIRTWRQILKHRHSSISEWSGRYSVLEPDFFLAPRERHLVQIGRPGTYQFVPGTDEQYREYVDSTKVTCQVAWGNYQDMLGFGIARELARDILPLNTYSSGYITVNARSLMNFLSLRTSGHDNALITSHPQAEIEQVADAMEQHFALALPAVHLAFEKNGRVAP